MKKYKITIIDHDLHDTLVLRDIIYRNFAELIEVDYFTSLEKGISNLEKKCPDMVILNIMFRNDTSINIYDLIQLNGIKILFVSPKSYLLNTAEKNSVYYIRKPFNVEDIIFSINKTINPHSAADKNETIKQLDVVTIASLDRIDFVDMKDIIFCVADGKYTTFHLLNGRKIISSKNLGEYEKVLNQLFFYRVHHGYIINIKHLISVIKTEGFFCKLANNNSVPIAKRKQSDFNRFIRIN